ncbi:3-carboxy-cis,cis-muconate cycloisomerase [Streptomyces camponoticapitis]|uniref:3-carboxy-cis,cis-muconate cycloisomerase n=1 Tax=Streptomyces camponoticapitis TaxID=1616125 RepID=A0ABQ2EKP1_9ACTN|nr:lyase family protein [Streptomyces camponoticapitis]GGK12940.1 3-carboxy-cis,cis-muconate cycloisomerase [Streptomyces camponoticapitis]
MTSADHPDHADRTGDAGLLSPGRAGSAAEAATGDASFLRAMLDAEAALARAQAAVGLTPTAAAEVITSTAGAELFDVRDVALRARAGGNPVIPLVADLTAAVDKEDTRAGGGTDAAQYVHRGATSQDIVDTAMMLVATRTVPLILADLDRAAEALAVLATAHRTTPMAGRTLTQHAVPTTFGLKAAGWLSSVRDARARLAAVRLPVQLGGAAGTLAAFTSGDDAVDGRPGRTSTAASSEPVYDLTGALDATVDTPPEPLPDYQSGPDPRFEPDPEEEPGAGPGPDEPVYDLAGAAPATSNHVAPEDAPPGAGQAAETDGGGAAGSDTGVRLLAAYADQLPLAEPTLPWHTLRTPVADLGAALAFAAGALGKVAADVLVLSRTEIGEVAEARGGGSSAMPHKRNPVRATLIAAAARQAPGLASVLLGALVAEDERPAGPWHAEWQPLRELLRLTGGAAHDAAELVQGLRIFPDRMRANLGLTQGLLVSERLLTALIPAVGRTRAKEVVGAAARLASRAGIPLAQALTETDPAISELIGEARLRSLTDPAGYTGSAPALVDRALAEHAAAGRALAEAALERAPDGPSEDPR